MMLSLDTAYRSFGGEVEASSTPTICRLPDSRRHQLSAIAPESGAAADASQIPKYSLIGAFSWPEAVLQDIARTNPMNPRRVIALSSLARRNVRYFSCCQN